MKERVFGQRARRGGKKKEEEGIEN